jgi:hypothetical protein
MKLFGIPPEYAPGRAGLAAGGNVIIVEPGNTEVALYCNFCVIIKLHCHAGRSAAYPWNSNVKSLKN